MKKLICLFGVLTVALLLCGLALAADDDDTHWVQETSGATWTAPNPYLEDWLNNNDIDHTHDIYIPERRNPIGVGLDLVVYQGSGIFEEAVVEAKHDFGNDETSVYAVGRVNLFKAAVNLINR